MKKIGNILTLFDPTKDKYISREFQAFGVHLAESLDDYKHKSLYIKLAKTTDRSLLERALSFCVDSRAKNKGALFMWKLSQLKEELAKNKTKEEKKNNVRLDTLSFLPNETK